MSAQNLVCQIGKFNENIPSYFPPEHLLFLLDANCNGSNILLQQANELKLFSHPYKWIVLDQADQKTFEGIFLTVDSRVFIIKNIVENDIYRIVSWYKIEENSSEFLENDVAEWHPKRGFLLYNELNSVNRSNMMGLNVNVTYTAMFSDSYNHLDDFRDTQLDPVLKTSWILTNCAMEMVNMTSTKIIRSSYGEILPNTTRYDGLVGDIQSGIAEIAGNSFYLRSDRIPIVEYVAPCCPSYLRFIFRAPPLSFVSNIFILPFDLYVWYSCLGLIAIILIVVYLIAVWESNDPIFKEKEHKSSSPKLEPGIFNALLMELGAITQQGTEAEPKSNSGRIATIITFICLMFLFTAYSANIVALLQSTAENIKNPQDLLNYSIALGMRDISFVHYYYNTSTEPILKAVYNKMSPKGQKPNFMTLEEGVARMQKEFFCISNRPYVRLQNSRKNLSRKRKMSIERTYRF
uniref:Ionotropic receptor 2 n=1 Tax=Pyrrhalta aenescens TaxID=281545 RepID=A0A1J0KKU2_9CUCU|nr:ionotropic receptor 2 [Pyrrhalta aenescens]